MKNIAFIINPASGTKGKRHIPRLIEKSLDHSLFGHDIIFTRQAGEATEMARRYVEMGFYAVVAVGGDGTVNEVARALRNTNTALGILPVGSGDGLARHLKLPLRTERAIQLLNHSEPILVDYGMMNDNPFFCTCGIGFDALISEQFAKGGKRGWLSYAEQIVSNCLSYQPEHYQILIGGEQMDVTAMVLTVANANQWGNNMYIAPEASIQDGWLDLAVLSKFPLVHVPGIALQLLTKTIHNDVFMTHIKTKELTLIRESEGVVHCDGEPLQAQKEIKIRVVEDGLKVLVGKRF